MKKTRQTPRLSDHVINECFLHTNILIFLFGWNTKWRRHHSTITTATVQLNSVLVWTLCADGEVCDTRRGWLFCFISWQFFRYNLKIVTSSSSSMLWVRMISILLPLFLLPRLPRPELLRASRSFLLMAVLRSSSSWFNTSSRLAFCSTWRLGEC